MSGLGLGLIKTFIVIEASSPSASISLEFNSSIDSILTHLSLNDLANSAKLTSLKSDAISLPPYFSN